MVFWRTRLRAGVEVPCPRFLSNPRALRVASGAGARVVWMLPSPADQPRGLPTSTALGLLVTARLHLTCVSFRVLFKSLLKEPFPHIALPPAGSGTLCDKLSRFPVLFGGHLSTTGKECTMQLLICCPSSSLRGL